MTGRSGNVCWRSRAACCKTQIDGRGSGKSLRAAESRRSLRGAENRKNLCGALTVGHESANIVTEHCEVGKVSAQHGRCRTSVENSIVGLCSVGRRGCPAAKREAGQNPARSRRCMCGVSVYGNQGGQPLKRCCFGKANRKRRCTSQKTCIKP